MKNKPKVIDYKMLVENNSDVIALLDTKGTIIYSSPSVKQKIGYDQADIVGKNISIFYTPEDIKLDLPAHDLIVADTKGKLEVENWRLRKDKWQFWAHVVITPLRHGKKPDGFVMVLRDITEQKRLEEVLRFQKTLMESQLEASIDGILVISTEGKIISYNNRLIEMWGLPRKVLVSVSSQATLKEIEKRITNVKDFRKLISYFEQHPDEDGHDEVFLKNGMVFERYSSPVKSLENIYYGRAWFYRDITERKLLEKRKDEFIAIASHELKTPLTTVKVFTQILQNQFNHNHNKEATYYLHKMDDQLNKLNKLIGDLLDVTKIGAGKINLSTEVFNFDELVKEIVNDLQRISEKHKLIISGRTSKTILGDKDRIGQVLINLILNAIKYSFNSNKIIIQLSANSKEISIGVQDFGIGISKADQEQIFERFYRVNDPRIATLPGLGLGLYISSEIVSRHQGKIWVSSEVGKGSTFWFSLPIKSK